MINHFDLFEWRQMYLQMRGLNYTPKFRAAGEIPPIQRTALAAVGKKARVVLVCGENETAVELPQRLDATPGKAMAENAVIDEVLPEIQRRR
jgi:hypothetical protein